MQDVNEAAAAFLANERVAVTRGSREPKSHGGNNVYRRLRERGYEVFAVNPNADTVEGDPAYGDLKSIPGGVEAVVIATRPERAEDTVAMCRVLFGDDYIAGGPDDDVIFGQLGEDTIQGDGEMADDVIDGTGAEPVQADRGFPAQLRRVHAAGG